MMDDGNNSGDSGGASGGDGGKGRKGPRTGRSGGIHHANIRDKEKTVKRLRAAFRKIPVKLTTERQAESVEAVVVLAEVSARSAYFFSSKKLPKNTSLVFNIGHPLA